MTFTAVAPATPLRALAQCCALQKRTSFLDTSRRMSFSSPLVARPAVACSVSGRRSFAASSQQQNGLAKMAKTVRDSLDRARSVRFPPGYWEMTWPEIQIKAAQYGLAGVALVGTFKVVNFSFELSTFLVTGSTIPPAVAYFGGFGTGVGVTLGAMLAHRAISIDEEELRRVAFGIAQKNFTFERTLGGNLCLGDSMASTVEAAGIYLKEKKRMTDYFAPFAWKRAEGHVLFQMGGEERTALVTVEVEKKFGSYAISNLRAEVQDETLPDDERVFQLLGEPSGSPGPMAFLGNTAAPPAKATAQRKVQLGNLW